MLISLHIIGPSEVLINTIIYLIAPSEVLMCIHLSLVQVLISLNLIGQVKCLYVNISLQCSLHLTASFLMKFHKSQKVRGHLFWGLCMYA